MRGQIGVFLCIAECAKVDALTSIYLDKIYAVLRAREISVLSGLRVFIDDFGANGLSENKNICRKSIYFLNDRLHSQQRYLCLILFLNGTKTFFG